MRKYSWLAAIIVVFAMLFAFAGCGGAGAGGSRPSGGGGGGGGGGGNGGGNGGTPTVINIAAIPGNIAPETGAPALTSIGTSTQYTGTITWTNDGEPHTGNFALGGKYTATITLTARTGFTLQGVAANFFTVAGATSVTNAANSGVITAVFAELVPMAVYNFEIKGVTPPVAGETAVTAITECYQYTGTVSWSPSHATFAESTTYTATITLTAKTGFFFDGVAANSFIVEGATATNPANSGVVTAIFPETGIEPVLVWSLADHFDKATFLATYSPGGGDQADLQSLSGWDRITTTSQLPILISSGTPNNHLLVVDRVTNPSSPSLLSAHSNVTSQQAIDLRLAHADIELKPADNIYKIRIEGAMVGIDHTGSTFNGYTNAPGRVQLALDGFGLASAIRDFYSVTMHNGPFVIYQELPETTANASADGHRLRIQVQNTDEIPLMRMRVDSIKILNYGPR